MGKFTPKNNNNNIGPTDIHCMDTQKTTETFAEIIRFKPFSFKLIIYCFLSGMWVLFHVLLCLKMHLSYKNCRFCQWR